MLRYSLGLKVPPVSCLPVLRILAIQLTQLHPLAVPRVLLPTHQASKVRCPKARCPKVRCPKVRCPKVRCTKVQVQKSQVPHALCDSCIVCFCIFPFCSLSVLPGKVSSTRPHTPSLLQPQRVLLPLAHRALGFRCLNVVSIAGFPFLNLHPCQPTIWPPQQPADTVRGAHG